MLVEASPLNYIITHNVTRFNTLWLPFRWKGGNLVYSKVMYIVIMPAMINHNKA